MKWADSRSYSFGATNGVRQGSIFSPRGAFCTYLDPLLSLLRNSGLGCTVGLHFYGSLAYCDDVILLALSVQSLQKMVKICETHASDNDLMFSTDPSPNLSKTVTIAFGESHDNLAPVYLNGDPLPWRDKVKHIGTTLDKNRLLDQDIIVK